ncbi:MAG: DUF4388 domain-containing protein [Sandaracinus sp.]|nr:DUF4388 domain-containing protein [Sandaracinus sp.]
MARPRIDIGPDGLVRPSDDAKDRLRRRYGPFELALDLPGVVVLRGESHARLQMAGEILNRMSVMEIINIVATSHWRGDLHVVSSEATRVLVFDQGALKGARSDAPVDRLGEVLFRGGFLDRAQLKTLVKETGEKRLGELAVERGYLDAGQLYQALQRQAEETFFNALLMADGFYAFLVDDDDEDPASTTVHLSVQGLLMEGVQRIDEMALFQERVPSTALCPKPVPDAPPPKKLDDAATRLLAMCDGDRSIDELGRLTGLGEFGATKAVYQLIQQKLVTLHAARRVDPQRVVALVARFNEILQDIFLAVATYGGLAQTPRHPRRVDSGKRLRPLLRRRRRRLRGDRRRVRRQGARGGRDGRAARSAAPSAARARGLRALQRHDRAAAGPGALARPRRERAAQGDSDRVSPRPARRAPRASGPSAKASDMDPHGPLTLG